MPTDAHLRTDEGRRLAAPQVAEWETTNVHQVATVLTAAALEREESRGGHARSDFPGPSRRGGCGWSCRSTPTATLVTRRAPR